MLRLMMPGRWVEHHLLIRVYSTALPIPGQIRLKARVESLHLRSKVNDKAQQTIIQQVQNIMMKGVQGSPSNCHEVIKGLDKVNVQTLCHLGLDPVGDIGFNN